MGRHGGGGHRHLSHHCLICGEMVIGRWICRDCREREAVRLGLTLLPENGEPC